MSVSFSFKLSPNFIEEYKTKEPNWGWKDAAGNSIGELTFVRTYSRVKEDGTKEKWWEVCERVINGMYSLQKDYCIENRLEWNHHKAQSSAQEAYKRLFEFKWTPPGRGLAQMGTPLVMNQKNAASLLNCAYTSTGDMKGFDPGYPFAWTTEALMLGIGVGFDTLGAGKFTVLKPGKNTVRYTIPDTREGWAISVGMLVNSYLKQNKNEIEFDYSELRPYGAVIKTFGGTASGPDPLREGHEQIRDVLNANVGKPITAKTIVDIQNIIGTFVVAGNARRSAELALGLPTDEGFIDLKNPKVYPDRPWAYMSNNSISADVGMDYGPYVKNTSENGEPGYVWLDVAREYGRLIDPPDNKDHRVKGFNPCFHPDTLVETVNGPIPISKINEPMKVYTRDHNGKLAIRQASAAFQTKKQAETLKIGLQNGDELIVTPDHKIMKKGGTWVEAKDLVVNDSLEVLCRTRRGWRYSGVRLNSQDPSEQVMEHRLIWEGVNGPIPEGFDIDHINGMHHDNRIENLRALEHGEHALHSISQRENNHQVLDENGKFTFSGVNGKKSLSRKIDPPRATNWKNQFTVSYIEEGPVVDVWDITVEDTHNLIANGVVAHNCVEQPLESYEMCCLVEVHLNRAESREDFEQTLKFAYLYGKTVTLLTSPWERTNAVMLRNRRIGLSTTGIAGFVENHSLAEYRKWADAGYRYVSELDVEYSEWLGIRESIRKTTVKPSGSVSLLSGATPGVHWSPGGKYFKRAIRFGEHDDTWRLLRDAGYKVEKDVYSANTRVVYFPLESDAGRAESEVSIYEKIHLAAEAQKFWSDNGVSVTVSFNAETEADDVEKVLRMYEGQLKAVSFLPMGNAVYEQQPYTSLTEKEFLKESAKIRRIDTNELYGHGEDAAGEAYCTTDVCEIKPAT